MCYGYYREKDVADKESASSQVTMTTQAEKRAPEASVAAAKQAEDKAAARFLMRIRRLVGGQDQKREEVA